MELQDFVITPIVILLVYAVAYLVRPYVTDPVNRRYFLPALTVRILGAITLGILYQFYYHGGDTYNYHTYGSRIVWEAFCDNPINGLRLIFGPVDDVMGIYEYTSRIPFLNDPSSYFLIRIAAFLDLFTFSTYSATATLFAALSFGGGWAFFVTFYRKYPTCHKSLAIGTLFIPSFFFWGSGILKDTIVIAALGFSVYFIDALFISRQRNLLFIVFLLISLFVIFELRKFVLQAFVPAAILWIYARYLLVIHSVAVRVIIFPVVTLAIGYLAYWSIIKVGEGDKKYAVDRIAMTTRITAYDIGFYTGRNAGSGYSLGEFDGTFSGILAKAPAAINVTLFRPYVWEIRNPLMFFSAIESLLLTLLVAYLVFMKPGRVVASLKIPDVIFTLTFSLSMAFGVGITSYNFGTLSRYKISLLPFFIVALILIYHQSKRERKLAELESTE